MPLLISPLARKLCATRGISPETLRGSGPRGRIMAADVLAPVAAPSTRRSGTARNTPALLPTRPEKDGYFLYDVEVDMKALADISLPIAVQCEKLLTRRYSLFDYIVRAVVKACTDESPLTDARVDVLLFENKGEKLTALADVGSRSIFQLARASASCAEVPEEFHPNIIICDSHTEREQVAARLQANLRPVFAFVARGGTPKAEVNVGCDAPNFDLPYTFYASTGIPADTANRIAARLQTLLVDPVSLLLL